MAVALGILLELGSVELQDRSGIHRVEPILLIDRLAAHDTPLTLAFFEEVEEATGADHVAFHAVDKTPLRDRHLGLHNGTVSNKVDAHAAEEMKNADASLPS